jgi:hypothetical protein
MLPWIHPHILEFVLQNTPHSCLVRMYALQELKGFNFSSVGAGLVPIEPEQKCNQASQRGCVPMASLAGCKLSIDEGGAHLLDAGKFDQGFRRGPREIEAMPF